MVVFVAEAERLPPERVSPEPTLISSIAPVDAVVRHRSRDVDIVRPLVVVAHSFTRFTHSTATTPADARDRVVSEA